MFRDWAWQDGNLVSVFLAGVQKVDGKPDDDTMTHVAAFRNDSVRHACFFFSLIHDSTVID